MPDVLPLKPPLGLRESKRRRALGAVRIRYAAPACGATVSGRRYYASSQGRFLGRDPVEEQGGLNLYGFCANNAVNRLDYLGMDDYLTQEGYYDEQGRIQFRWVSGGGMSYEEFRNANLAAASRLDGVSPLFRDSGQAFAADMDEWRSFAGVSSGMMTTASGKAVTFDVQVGIAVVVPEESPNSGPSVVAVIADAAAGSGLGTIPKPTTGLGAGGLTPTSPASIIARTGLPKITLLEPLPAPTMNNPNITSTNLGTVAGRVVPVAGVVVAVAETVTSPNPLRTGVGQTFGFIVGALGGTAGVIASAPAGGLALPVTATAGALAGSWAGNRLGLSLYDSIAGLFSSPAPTPQPPSGRPPGG